MCGSLQFSTFSVPFCMGESSSVHPLYIQCKQKPEYHFAKLYLHTGCWHVTQAQPIRLNYIRLQFRQGQCEKAETEQNALEEDVAVEESSFQGTGSETLQHRMATITVASVRVATVVSTPSRCVWALFLAVQCLSLTIWLP